MEHLILDRERCARDGLCARVCPLGLIRMQGDEGWPEVREGLGKACIRCGHCVAVCPKGALSLDVLDLDACAPIERGLAVAPEAAEQLMRSRRSVRAYKEEPPDRAMVERLLDTARYAPSGHNAQPVAWAVARGRAAVERVVEAAVAWMEEALTAQPELAATLHLAGLIRAWRGKGKDLICRGAPCLVTAHLPKGGITPRTDAVIALSWLELAAHAHGLGACWAGYVNFAAEYDPGVARALGLPEDRLFAGALMLGHPVCRYSRIPPRKPLDIIWRD